MTALNTRVEISVNEAESLEVSNDLISPYLHFKDEDGELIIHLSREQLNFIADKIIEQRLASTDRF